MFKYVISLSIFIFVISVSGVSVAHATGVDTVSQTEERAVLLTKLDVLVRLLGALQLQLTQQATSLSAQSVPPQLMSTIPPPPPVFSGVLEE